MSGERTRKLSALKTDSIIKMECNSNCDSDADGVDDSYNIMFVKHLHTSAVIAHNNIEQP